MFKLSFLIVFLINMSLISDISRINQLKEEAQNAYKGGQYRVAAARYQALVDSFGVKDDAVWLNLAHSYFHIKDSARAQSTYAALFNSTDAQVRSSAYLQMGNVKAWNPSIENYEKALFFYKKALQADSNNDKARKNYETIKKLLDKMKQNQQEQNQDNKNNENQKDQNQQNQQNQKDNENQQKKDQPDQNQDNKKKENEQTQQENEQKKKEQEQKKKEQEQQQKEQEKKDKELNDGKPNRQNEKNPNGEQRGREEKKEQSSLMPDRLQEIKVSPEQAQMLLETMKNQEVQYLQQRSKANTRKADKSRPDW